VEIEYSPKFAQMYKKLPKKVKAAAEKKEKIFRKDPFDPQLSTHRLGGKLKDYWSFSIDYRYRIIFSFEGKNLVRFYAVGTREIY
jgi:addiction module RelE/StbE family toxin